MMTSLKIITFSVCLVTLIGCSTYSSNMRVGDDMSHYNIEERRAAVRSVGVYDTAPKNSKKIGVVTASRCHRRFTESGPNENILMTDLKIAAYAQGADGITDVEIDKQSGLTANCWYIINAKATAFQKTE